MPILVAHIKLQFSYRNNGISVRNGVYMADLFNYQHSAVVFADSWTRTFTIHTCLP